MKSEIKIYNLRIVPPNPIFNEVVEFKKQFITIFGKHPLSTSKPHITIAEFKMDIQYQEILLTAFRHLSNIEKFELDINGFGVFENNSHVLHLKVSKTEGIEEIYKQLKILWIRELHRKLTSLKNSNTPHITISKTDGKPMLSKSFEFFHKTDYKKSFEVFRLTLVSRYENRTWDWEHHIELS